MHWKRFVILLGLLAIANVTGLLLLPLLRYSQIVTHHSASAVDNLESIRDGHGHWISCQQRGGHSHLRRG